MDTDNKTNFEEFVYRVTLMQGDAIDLSESKYLGDDKPIIVRCTRDLTHLAVERADQLFDEDHPFECPLCQERRKHARRMGRIRMKESKRLRSAMELIKLL